MKKAFVSGGTGFLGINLIEKLLADGWQVTALHRPTSNLTYLKRSDVQLVKGSLADKEALLNGIPEEVDAVFHLAADINLWKKKNAAQTLTNVTGTRNMVEAALEKKAKCFIHTSSIATWGQLRGLIDEQTPQAGERSWINYEKTKWMAEQEVLKAKGSAMKIVLLNPANIIGPYDKTGWAKVFFALKNNELPFSPPGEGCFAHVHEVAKAHISAVDQAKDGEKYILGGVNAAYADFVKEITALLKMKAPPVISPFLFKTLGQIFTLISYITQKEPLITNETADLSTRMDFKFSSEKAKQELGFKEVPLEVCAKDCYDWLVKEGLF